MDKRKAEIAAKRAKLEELRKAREERAKQSSASSTSIPSTRAATPSTTAANAAAARADVDALVRDLVDRPSTRQSATSTTSTTADGTTSPAAAAAAPAAPATTTTQEERTASPVTATPVPTTDPSIDERGPSPPLVVQPAKITYDKAIQTQTTDESTQTMTLQAQGDTGGAGKESEQEMRQRIIAQLDQERRQLDEQLALEQAKLHEEQRQARLTGLPTDRVAQIMSSAHFVDFLDNSTKIVERALSDPYDYLRDYSITANDDDGTNGATSDKSRIRLFGKWYDERLNRGRSVTALDWSPKYAELFATAYNRNPLSINEPDGIVCVWNLHLSDRPEFVFHAQSDVLSLSFSPFNPNVLVGGTYSGQIVLWDTRSRNPNPSLKTPLNANGHTHPVYSTSIVGSQNAHNLVSASTDGTVCAWALDMLARPQESVELTQSNHAKTDEVSTTSLAFPDGESATCYVGTEDGNVYAAHRYDRAGAKAGLVPDEVYRGHAGPITAIDFHPVAGPIDLSNLFLTSSIDWTVKLWRAGASSSSSSTSTTRRTSTTTTTNGSTSTKNASTMQQQPKGTTTPTLNFEAADDYVFDVRWHPRHPAVFGTVDGSGKFNFWNLNVETEVPLVSTVVGGHQQKGANKLAWDRAQGRKVAVGSSDGATYVYDVQPHMVSPQESDWEQMRTLVQNAAAASGPVV